MRHNHHKKQENKTTTGMSNNKTTNRETTGMSNKMSNNWDELVHHAPRSAARVRVWVRVKVGECG